MFNYIRDPDEIYRRSFAAVRAEADLARLSPAIEEVAVRLVHACGMPDITADLAFSEGAAEAGRQALRSGAPVLVDGEMLRAGIVKDRLPAANTILCTLHRPETPSLARKTGTTRAAAAVELWRRHLEGAVVAIGNAPTALFRLLELLAEGAGPPALIAAFPVGFVGAAESKEALIADAGAVPYVTLRGRRGGSALAAATINALGNAPGGKGPGGKGPGGNGPGGNGQ
ncbi:MAG: precorrin-8X methylmutase [Rhodospirillales bacterium]|jgi:precorrin-8X/cobalt-precorrin-8 methylmutase|nr:precorrin-8X methylmutase [Rhodospirillales bacterium]HJO72722.1 precorrin-8X methylmutase [Rhodospirillales bacterium]